MMDNDQWYLSPPILGVISWNLNDNIYDVYRYDIYINYLLNISSLLIFIVLYPTEKSYMGCF